MGRVVGSSPISPTVGTSSLRAIAAIVITANATNGDGTAVVKRGKI